LIGICHVLSCSKPQWAKYAPSEICRRALEISYINNTLFIVGVLDHVTEFFLICILEIFEEIPRAS
jgi:hypothetical protein